MTTLTDKNRNAVAAYIAFLIVIAVVGFGAHACACALSDAFKTRANNSGDPTLYKEFYK